MHAHPPHAPEGLKDFLKAMFATFVGLLMALALESWHQNHRAESLAHAQLRAVRAELEANLAGLQTLEKELMPVVEQNRLAMAYLDATPEARRGMTKPPYLDWREFNFVWSAWEGAVAMGIQKHLTYDQNRELGRIYALIRRFQGLQDQGWGGEMLFRSRYWQEDWSALTPEEFRLMKHASRQFTFFAERRLLHARIFRDEIEKALGKL